MAPGALDTCIINCFKAQMDKCCITEQLAICQKLSLV